MNIAGKPLFMATLLPMYLGIADSGNRDYAFSRGLPFNVWLFLPLLGFTSVFAGFLDDFLVDSVCMISHE